MPGTKISAYTAHTALAVNDLFAVVDSTAGSTKKITASIAGKDLTKLGLSVGTSAPTSPYNGQPWIDTTTNPPLVKIWNGATWTILGLLDSPAFTGTPTAPTAAVDTNTTQIATTGFVVGQAGSTNPLANGTAAAGVSLRYARQDHVHPSDTSRAPTASPTFSGTATFSGDVVMSGTGYLDLPVGTTAQRPSVPSAGMVRYNSTIGQFEGYTTTWGGIGGGATGGGSDRVFNENDQTVTTDYTITTNRNAVSAGPVTINSGITVTIPSGSNWAIV